MADGHLGLGLACIVLAAGANVAGGLAVTWRRWDEDVLRSFVALGAGFMLAAVVLKMIPESARLTADWTPGLVLVGYFLVHLAEHTVAPHFHFGEETHHEHMTPAVGVSALVGLAVHSFFDGLSIGSGFVVDPALGVLLFFAIVLHKAPEGFTIASIVLAARGTRAQALQAAAAVGAATLAGGLVIFAARGLVGMALGVSAGVTLYVAASDLVPEVNREGRVAGALTVFAGVVLYGVTEWLLAAAGL